MDCKLLYCIFIVIYDEFMRPLLYYYCSLLPGMYFFIGVKMILLYSNSALEIIDAAAKTQGYRIAKAKKCQIYLSNGPSLTYDQNLNRSLETQLGNGGPVAEKTLMSCTFTIISN